MSCISPITIYDKKHRKTNTFACRQCINCRITAQSNYEFQCVMARQQAFRDGLGCSFVTLTYSNDHVPLVSDNYGNVNMTLRKKDLQDFYKRLRRNLDYYNYPVNSIQYFSCGEYGDRFDRPHYHFLCFGLDSVTANKVVSRSWKLGLTDCGVLRAGGIRYVVDYVLKNKTGKLARTLYDSLNLERPFLSHSVRLGLDYFFDNFNYNDQDFTYIRSGKKVPLPSFYRKKIDPYRHYSFTDIQGELAARQFGLPYETYKFMESVKLAESKVVSDRLHHIPTFDVPLDSVNYARSLYTTATTDFSSLVDSALEV